MEGELISQHQQVTSGLTSDLTSRQTLCWLWTATSLWEGPEKQPIIKGLLVGVALILANQLRQHDGTKRKWVPDLGKPSSCHSSLSSRSWMSSGTLQEPERTGHPIMRSTAQEEPEEPWSSV